MWKKEGLRRWNYTPEGDALVAVDSSVWLSVTKGDEEADDDVDEKRQLAGNVEKEKILRQASEESELHWCEEWRVDCPYQYEMRPYHIPPAYPNLTVIFQSTNCLCAPFSDKFKLSFVSPHLNSVSTFCLVVGTFWGKMGGKENEEEE